jgi:phosphoglycolate phosphatase
MKTIIFDFDGTIADTLSLILEIADKLAKKYSYKKITKKDILRLREKTYAEAIRELGKFGMPVFRLPFLLKEGKDLMAKEVSSCKPFSGLVEALKTLKEKGFSLGILTSNFQKNVELFLKKNNLEIFDFIYSDNNPFLLGKGDKLKKLIEKNHWRQDEVTYIGDETRDAEAAKKAGVKIISVAWGFNSQKILKKQKPDFLIDKPEQLISIKL